MIPKNHVLYGIVFAQPNATCAASVVAHLYFARAKYPLFCYNCGTEDVQPVSNELKQQLYSVHPLCEDCRSKNVKECTCGTKKSLLIDKFHYLETLNSYSTLVSELFN